MDVRLLALRQEQSTAFGRAAAAGFNSGNMTDLMAFSEYFGADRLRVACINFLIVSQRRVTEPSKLNLQAMSSGYDMSGSPQVSARLSQSNRSDMPNGKHYCENESTLMENDQIEEKSFSKGTGGTEARKRWRPLANIRPELFGDQNQIDPASASFNVESPSINEKSETGFPKSEKACIQECSRSLINDAAESRAHILVDPVQDNSLVHITVLKMDQSSESQIVPDMVITPHEPNSLPNNQTNIVKPKAGHVQEHNKDNLSAPARRLSVQDAISLFEDKKKKELATAPGKQRLGKQESGRASMEGINASSSGSIAPRRWSTANGSEVGEVLQGSQESRKGTGDVLLPRQDLHAVEPRLNVFLKASYSPTMKPEETSNNVFATKDQNLGVIFSKTPENKLQDPIHLNLEKGTAQVALARSDLPLMHGPSKCDSNLSMTRTDDFLNSEYCDKGPSAKPEITYNSREQEKGNLPIGLWQPMTMEEGSILQTPSLDIDAAQNDLKSSMASPEIKQANVIKEQCTKDATTKVFANSEIAANQSSRRESLGSSRVDSFQYGMQDHVSMDVAQASVDIDNLSEHRGSSRVQYDMQDHVSMYVTVDVENISEHRGRFYEQYRKLRDAKLMVENDSRRAQREAKLRLMEETLLLRKAELDAQAMRQSKINHHQARATKLQARMADFHILQRAKEGGSVERYREFSSSYSDDRSISPPFTPLAGKEQASNSKSQSGRKPAAISTKGATPPRSSIRGTSVSPKLTPRSATGPIRGTSVSPKLTPRSATGSTAKPRKSAASSVLENPLAKSVPSFANLRKENTKPSAGRQSGNAGLQAKDGGSAHFRAVSEAHPLEANVNVLVCTPPPGNGAAKDNKVHGLSLVRKSHADVKILSTSSDDGVSAHLKVQREVEPETSEATTLSKSNRNGAGPFEEAKQSTEKGSNSGPICLVGMIQQLPLPTVEATYDSNEERAPITRFLESNRTDGNNQMPEEIQGTISQIDAYKVENMNIDVTDAADFAQDTGSRNFPALQMKATDDASGEQGSQFFTIDAAASPSKEPYFREDLQCYRDGDGDGSQSCYVADTSTSFRTSSLPRELHLPVIFHDSASPPNSRVAQAVSGHFSPSTANTLKSPLESPANWKSSQTCASEAEITQLNKKLASSQKLAMFVSTKEPAKGFKRLLKFARKNRAVDAATADWVSTSEGDDESEDQRLSIDELNARGRLEEKTVFDISGEQNTTPDQVSAAQSLRSSIPTPPTNFRLRDDHLMGSTMLKAPKSFFLLSSFRNKGIEGKAR